jgi:hypothetical protein
VCVCVCVWWWKGREKYSTLKPIVGIVVTTSPICLDVSAIEDMGPIGPTKEQEAQEAMSIPAPYL